VDAASSIKYQVNITGKDRLVWITGQVHFNVTYNASRPFYVNEKGQVMKDLGTAFNINAYNDEPVIRVTLEEGSINVSKGQQSAVLIPGQQAITKTSPVKDLIQITRATSMGPLQILRWDNYINLFLAKYPVIDFAFFLTQKDGQLNFEPKYQEIEIYDLFEQTLEGKENWIINIDIDYFFTKPDGQWPIQYYTDEFIRATGRWISKKIQAIAQITICLSPECCGGWDNAMHVANLFGEEFDFHLS